MKCIHCTKGAGGDIATIIGTVLMIFNILVWGEKVYRIYCKFKCQQY